MAPTGMGPPQDEEWQLEWRWGTAHPWLRPKGVLSSSTSSNASFPVSPSPYHLSRSSPSVASSASVSSAPACDAVSASSPFDSSSDSYHLPSEPPPPSSWATSRTSFSANMRKSPLHDDSTREDSCSVPEDAATSSSTVASASPWPLSSPFSSVFSPVQIRNTSAPSQRESRAHPGSRETRVDIATQATRIAHAAAASAPIATAPAASPPAATAGEGQLLPEHISRKTPPRPVLFRTETGADGLRLAAEEELEGASLRVTSAAGSPSASGGPLLRETTPAAFNEPKGLPGRNAVANVGGEYKREMPETGVAGAGAPVRSNVSLAATSAAASAISGAAAGVEEVRRALQRFEKGAEEPQRMQQLLLQFGDQTLNFLQRQQMKLWTFFAFRDWRVNTLVHALSAMGAPVNLVVVDCTPPAPESASSSPSSSSSSVDASAFSAASSSPSLSHSRSPPVSPSMLTSTLPRHLPSFTASREETRTCGPPSDYWLFAEQHSRVPMEARAAAAPPACRSPAGLTPPVLPAISERLLASAADTEQHPGGRVTAARKKTEQEATPVPEVEIALLSSVSPVVGEDVVRGGYSPLRHTVWLCGNRLWSPFELRRVLLHELVHAFDFARANVSPNNCRHVACTEIRAYNLSGQCSWWRTRSYDIEQFNAVQPRLSPKAAEAASGLRRQQHQEEAQAYDSGEWQPTKRNRCLMHGALNSLRQHRRCQAPGVAGDAVRDVFTRCVRDTWPFLAPPERDSKWRPSRMWRPEAEDYFKK